MNLNDLTNDRANVVFQVTPKDLQKFGKDLITATKKETKHELKKANNETYLTSDEVCNIYSISKVTLWNYDKKGITNPLRIGNKKRYRKSEIEAAFQEKEKGRHE